jgi:crossover junction endodeoxyribonuclease RuvC
LCGNGAAPKIQIQKMVQLLLNLEQLPEPDDAADGLAIAICHANHLQQKIKTVQ